MTMVVILSGAFLIHLFLNLWFRRHWKKFLTVEVKFQESYAYEGKNAKLTETIINGKRMFLPVLQVGFQIHRNLRFEDGENTSVSDLCYKRDIFAVGSYQKITRTVSFSCTKRGYYTLEKVELVTRSPLLTEKHYETLENTDAFYVYPAAIATWGLDMAFQKMMGSVWDSRNLYEDPFAFRGIREYQSTDPMQRINWKAAAKTGTLMVNQYNSTISVELLILLDVEDETVWKYDDIHEEEIRLAASLASRFLQEGIPLGMITNGNDILTKKPFHLRPGSGKQQIQKINQALARLDLTQEVQPMEFVLDRLREQETDRCRAYIMISKNQKASCQEAFLKLVGAGNGSIWISTLYKEMEWKPCYGNHVSWMRWEVKQ